MKTRKKFTKKISINKLFNVRYSFTSENITHYSGLALVSRFLNHHNFVAKLENMFPTIKHNATKFSTAQVLISYIFAFISGISRTSRVSRFTHDPLVKRLLNLPKGINKDALAFRLKKLGSKGAEKLRQFHLRFNSNFLKMSGLTKITLDADSTYLLTYGNQEGAEKSYNPHKKGAKTYHPLLIFLSDLKILFHSKFRKGSAYTSKGIIQLLKEVNEALPKQIKKVFFRGDSGFFSLEIISYIRDILKWDYLIKVKLRNLEKLLQQQQWEPVKGHKKIWQCTFEYVTVNAREKITIKAIRKLVKEEEIDFFGQKIKYPVYEYAAYVSNLDLEPYKLHKKYTRRATSETWIEQVKSQLMAGKTFTRQFDANDILWQLSVWAYNISVMMRWKKKKLWKLEHATFRDLIINIGGKIVYTARQWHVKMPKTYLYKDDWIKLAQIT